MTQEEEIEQISVLIERYFRDESIDLGYRTEDLAKLRALQERSTSLELVQAALKKLVSDGVLINQKGRYHRSRKHAITIQGLLRESRDD
jgi:hypothetical protein